MRAVLCVQIESICLRTSTEEDMEAGESEIWQSNNFVATIWQDKRAVRFLSTCCEPEGDEMVKRRRKKEGALSQLASCCKIIYKIYGRVDRSDRMFVRILFLVRAGNGGSVSSIIFWTWQWQIVLFFIITQPATINLMNSITSNNCLLLLLEHFQEIRKFNQVPKEKERKLHPSHDFKLETIGQSLQKKQKYVNSVQL
jgi:hypothetical protein